MRGAQRSGVWMQIFNEAQKTARPTTTNNRGKLESSVDIFPNQYHILLKRLAISRKVETLINDKKSMIEN